MNIILVSSNLNKSRVVTLTQSQIVMVGIGFVLLLAIFGGIFYSITMRYAIDVKDPYLQSLFSSVYQKEALKNQTQFQDKVNALATKLGEMQARLMRLDAVGERLAKISGIKLKDITFDGVPGQGGAIASSVNTRDMSVRELTDEVDKTSNWLKDRADQFTLIDTALLDARLKKHSLPTALPVTKGYFSSNFGKRVDPFSGRRSVHEGIDFVAPPGTNVQAAAGGIVVESVQHADYGNMIDVDHGNGLITKYAHLSRRSVNVGDVVLKGQVIGELGSTGRSTGPHLHFEVRQHGAALDPKRFLELDG